MKKTLQHFTLLLVFVSCTSNEKAATPKTYSEDTNRAFEMIERGGSYYLKKAPTYTAPPQIETPVKIERKKIPVAQVQPAREEIVIDENISEPTPIIRNTKPAPKVDERLIEINQNLAFYCMKNRKNPAYGGDEAKCMKHVDKVMNDCKKQHSTVNSKLLNCIQKKFKGKK